VRISEEAIYWRLRGRQFAAAVKLGGDGVKLGLNAFRFVVFGQRALAGFHDLAVQRAVFVAQLPDSVPLHGHLATVALQDCGDIVGAVGGQIALQFVLALNQSLALALALLAAAAVGAGLDGYGGRRPEDIAGGGGDRVLDKGLSAAAVVWRDHHMRVFQRQFHGQGWQSARFRSGAAIGRNGLLKRGDIDDHVKGLAWVVCEIVGVKRGFIVAGLYADVGGLAWRRCAAYQAAFFGQSLDRFQGIQDRFGIGAQRGCGLAHLGEILDLFLYRLAVNRLDRDRQIGQKERYAVALAGHGDSDCLASADMRRQSGDQLLQWPGRQNARGFHRRRLCRSPGFIVRQAVKGVQRLTEARAAVGSGKLQGVGAGDKGDSFQGRPPGLASGAADRRPEHVIKGVGADLEVGRGGAVHRRVFIGAVSSEVEASEIVSDSQRVAFSGGRFHIEGPPSVAGGVGGDLVQGARADADCAGADDLGFGVQRAALQVFFKVGGRYIVVSGGHGLGDRRFQVGIADVQAVLVGFD